MSFETQLATPLPKPWCNPNVHNLVCDSLTTSGLVLSGPFTVTETTPSKINTNNGTGIAGLQILLPTNATTNYVNSGLVVYNNANTGVSVFSQNTTGVAGL